MCPGRIVDINMYSVRPGIRTGLSRSVDNQWELPGGSLPKAASVNEGGSLHPPPFLPGFPREGRSLSAPSPQLSLCSLLDAQNSLRFSRVWPNRFCTFACCLMPDSHELPSAAYKVGGLLVQSRWKIWWQYNDTTGDKVTSFQMLVAPLLISWCSAEPRLWPPCRIGPLQYGKQKKFHL